MSDYGERIPPHDLNAEKSVLGAMLLNDKAVNQVISLLAAEDFYMLAHQQIYTAMCQLYEKSKPIDLTTVSAIFDDVSYLAELTGFVPVTSNAKQYAYTVKNMSERRQIMTFCGTATDQVHEGKEKAEIVEQLEQSLYSLYSQKTRSVTTFQAAAEKAIARTESKFAGDYTEIKTGFPTLDALLLGIACTDLVIVAARPAVGKTSFALDLAEKMTVYQDLRVCFFSREMPAEDLADKMLSKQTRVKMANIKTGKLTDDEWDRYAGYENRNIIIDDNPNKSIAEMKSVIREQKPDVVIIDYLQLMETKAENRNQEISKITRRLKTMALELKIPFIVLSQLSRNCEQRANKRPMLSDLRESGSIEQDADKVLGIYRGDIYENDPAQRDNTAEIIVLKNRGGKEGTAKLMWDGDYTTFYDIDTRH